MTVDSELIFALAEQSRGRTAHALERLVGSMATAWLDEGREELLLARGMGRPLWIGTSTQELFFASTRAALDLVEEYSSVKLRKREVREGSVLGVSGGRIVGRDSFRPDMSFEERSLRRCVHERGSREPRTTRRTTRHLAFVPGSQFPEKSPSEVLLRAPRKRCGSSSARAPRRVASRRRAGSLSGWMIGAGTPQRKCRPRRAPVARQWIGAWSGF